jgi:hypothetical protein
MPVYFVCVGWLSGVTYTVDKLLLIQLTGWPSDIVFVLGLNPLFVTLTEFVLAVLVFPDACIFAATLVLVMLLVLLPGLTIKNMAATTTRTIATTIRPIYIYTNVN